MSSYNQNREAIANEYRQRALNRVNGGNLSKEAIANEYRQRALNRQQAKVEEPKLETTQGEETKYNFTPEDATNLKNTLNSRLAISNAINYPKIVEEKKAEREEQERWDNLSLGEKIADPFKTAEANRKHSALGIEESQAWTEYRNKQDEESLAKAQAATKAREEYELSNDRIGKGNAFTRDFAGYIPQMLGQIGAGVGNAAGGAAAGAGTALAIGQLGPQVGLPEELITVPTGALWGGRAGYVAGTGKYNYDLVVGTAYKTLLDMGVPNDIALELSGNEAVINGAIEALGSVVDLASFGAGSVVKEPLKRFLTGAVKSYVANLISEPTEEGLQRKVSIEIEKEAAKRAGIERKVTESEDWQSILDDMKAARNVALFTGLGNVGGNIVNNVMQTNKNTNIDTRKLPTIDSKTLNQLTEISKNIEEQKKVSETAQPEKNVVRGLPTMASQQAMLSTNRAEGQTAQTGNMEQTTENGSKSDNFVKGLEKFKAKDYTQKDNIVVLDETPQYLYNLGYDSDKPIVLNMNKLETIMKEPKGTVGGKNQHGITMDIVEQLPNAIQNPLNVIKNPKFNNRFVVVTELTDQYGDIVIVPIEMNTNGYIENIETNVNKIASVYGKEYYDMAAQEGLDSYMEVNKNNIVYDIDKDPTAKRNTTTDYRLQLPSTNSGVLNNSINQNDNSVNTQYAQTEQKGYISPAQDMQKATEFINKATVEDIDTLNKMVEEAEKHPDRLDLQFFAEKARARLEKLSREQIENMLEEGIDTNKISYNDSIYRNVRRVLGDKGYQYVKEHILDKLDAAKLDNVNMKIKYANELKSYVVDELGIKKDSKQSELVQNYGEKEITLDELKEATPNWENVVKADNWFRSKYDELIDMLNESRTEIYPYVEERIEATELELEVVKQQIKDIEENGTPNYKKDAEIRTQIENIQKRIDAKDEKLKSIKNKDTMAYKNNLRIKNEAVERLNDLNDLLDIRAENKLDKLKAKADKLQKILDSEELWRGKRIPKRKDYYRHFQEMTEGFEALGNILATPSEISNQLSGISENTKPNSKWLGLAQRRLTNKTKYDAVGGFLNYLDSASYAINIDPEIKRIRDFTEEIRNASGDNTTANRLIEYLTDYANDLAGKTNPMDRYLQKIIPGGRKTMKAISWLTNRIKSNAVLGNFNSAAAQILNLPQGLADIKNPKNIGIGFWETLTGKDSRYKDSQFITERFESDVYSQFDEKLIDQPKKFATWLLGALDEFGTKTIWNGEYSKAVDMGIKDPVRYADYRTRDLVAGRGIGELSLNQRSKTIGLLAPFTVEVSNYWGVVKDFISAKDFGGLILLQVFGHLFNKGLEELGVSASVFDLIDALIDAWNTEGGIDKKAGRVAGEFLSNTMFGQQFASIYPENGADLGVYKLPTRSELFGDADPTRMGTGSVLSKAITNPITSVVMPWGGTQLNKTTQGLSTFAKGGSYTKDAEGKDKLKYPVEQTPSNAIKSALFGKWATPGAKDYIDRGFKPLSANQTEAYEKAIDAGISSDDFFKAYDATRGIEGDKDKNGKTIENSKSKKLKEAIDKATTKLTSKQRKILYDAFNVSKTVQGGSGLPTQSELRANLPKVQIKIEK